MRNSTKLIKQLTGLALALTICTSQLVLPAYSRSRLAPFATASDANSSNLAEKPSVEKATTTELPGFTTPVSTPISRPDKAVAAQVSKAYGKLPLSFEANLGQTDARVKFLSRGSGYSLFLTSREAVLCLKSPKFKVRSPKSGSRTPDFRLQALRQCCG